MHRYFGDVGAMMVTRNFNVDELACSCCGFFNADPVALEMLQNLRYAVGKPLIINSACRCPMHNARVGGAPMSRHRATRRKGSTAFDISLAGHDKDTLISLAEEVGFNGIGVNYSTFIHVDCRDRRARW